MKVTIHDDTPPTREITYPRLAYNTATELVVLLTSSGEGFVLNPPLDGTGGREISLGEKRTDWVFSKEQLRTDISVTLSNYGTEE